MFNERLTKSLLLVVSFASLLYFGIYFIDGCSFYYDHQYSIWTFGVEPCSEKISFYFDMCYNASLFVIIAGIDTVVFMRLRALTKKMKRVTAADPEAQKKLLLERDARLFLQVLVRRYGEEKVALGVAKWLRVWVQLG
ncbi:hypothetical protein COOONC_09143 [Cooperia oncophora]